MGQQVNVYEDLVFRGRADYQANVKGNFMMEKVYLYDHFLYGLDEQDWDMNTTYGTTSTIAHSAVVGGVALMTTGTTTLDVCELAHNIVWHPTKNCVMEARVQVNSADTVAINVGWTDGTQDANDEICFEMGSGNTMTDARATDGAAFVYDTNCGVDVWYITAVNNDTELAAPVSLGTGVLPVADTYETLRVALNITGGASFYRNGRRVGYIDAALQYDATADLLTPYVAVITRDNVARVLTVDRITCWQDE